MDLLKLYEYLEYPKCEEPLLWAIGRTYYYNGEPILKVKGGAFFETPKIELIKDIKDEKLEIKPVNMKNLIKVNEKQLFILENEAMDFIHGLYDNYEDKSVFTVSYSGGKDSQAVLDLVTRVIPPDKLIVVFSDTTLESKFTYENLKKTRSHYLSKYPNLEFRTARPAKTAIKLMEYAGLPSRFKRWCTDALKTAPFNNLLRSISREHANVIVFEGVRSEESSKRLNYSRIEHGVKHSASINARPILEWNITEVYLYIFYRKLHLNRAYRWGLNRVGCIICPYASSWTEFVNSKIDKESITPYISFIEDYAKARGVPQKSIKKFINNGEWKKRAGGMGLDLKSNIIFSEKEDKLKGILEKPREDFMEWSKVLGERIYKEHNGVIEGEIRIDEHKINFKSENFNSGKRKVIEFSNIKNSSIKSKIRKVLYKTTFCVNCGICESECPNFALKSIGGVKINPHLCENCHKCSYFSKNGCIVAASVYTSVGGKMKKKTSGIDKYSTFGLRQEWLNEFFVSGEEWLSNNTLGPKQVPAVLRWLIDAEILDRTKKTITELGHQLLKIYEKDRSLAWLIIWNNMYYNSAVVEWYLDKNPWKITTNKQDLKERITQDYPGYSKGTLSNPIDAMINMFDNSPLGRELGIGIIEKKGRAVKSITKAGVRNIEPYAVAYSLYKLAENTSRRNFTITELFNEETRGGPYKIFGLPQEELEKTLRGLQERKERTLNVELAADLDNIHLRDDLTPKDILKIYLGAL